MDAGNSRREFRGFTLIELLVTIAVIVVMATIAVPNFRSFVASNQFAAEYNQVLVGLNYARSEAVKRRGVVGASVIDGGSGWVMEVTHDGELIRTFGSSNDNISFGEVDVEFTPLGRRGACLDPADDADLDPCRFSFGERIIEINLAGHVTEVSSDG